MSGTQKKKNKVSQKVRRDVVGEAGNGCTNTMVVQETVMASVVARGKIFDAGGELMNLGPNNPYGSTPARGSAGDRLAARRR